MTLDFTKSCYINTNVPPQSDIFFDTIKMRFEASGFILVVGNVFPTSNTCNF